MAYLLLVLQQVIAGSTHLVAKSVTHAMHPTTVVLFRGAFTVVVYGAWYLIRRSTLIKIDRSDWGLILLLGLVNLPINQLCFIWGVKYTTAPNAALAYALTPVFVVLLLSIGQRKRPGWKQILGVCIAVLGATVVLTDKGVSVSGKHLVGNVMVLAASASWALYTVMGRRLVARYGALQATALTFFSGFALYVPTFLLLPVPLDVHVLVASSAATDAWLQLFYLGVITSGVGYGLWYYALTHLETHRVAVFNNLQPVITTILAFFIFGTQPTPMFIAGGVIALVGVVITQTVD